MSPEISRSNAIYEPFPEAQGELVILSRSMFREGSLGQALFPEVLEGRLRPDPFTASSFSFSPRTDLALQVRGIVDLKGVLNLTQEDLVTLPYGYQARITRRLPAMMEKVAEKQMLTPHSRLIGAIFGEAQGPVEPKAEIEVQQAVERALATLDERSQKILRLRHGFENGQSLSNEEVRKPFGLSTERVRRIESKAYARLSHPFRRGQLQQYSALPLNSVGRLVGFTYRKDLPLVPAPIAELGISAKALDELLLKSTPSNFTKFVQQVRESFGSPTREEALKHEFESFVNFTFQSTISEQTKEEIATKLRLFLRQRAEPYAVFGDLLPEVSYPNDTTKVARNTTLDHLTLSDKARRVLLNKNATTLGALMDIERNERGRILGMSPAVSHEIGEAVAKLVFYLDAITDDLKS